MSDAAIDTATRLAADLLGQVRALTADGDGVTRDAYGAGEEAAAKAVEAVARSLALRTHRDWALNLHVTWEGTNPKAPAIMIGSHLDSVPRGGNFDGLAGVAAGLAAIAALKGEGRRLDRDIVVLGIRSEENAWFGAQHVGSRAALGLLDPAILSSARRADTGRSLADHMKDAGADLSRAAEPSAIRPDHVACFLELHIEQGPLLVDRGDPIGIVTGIRGNRRCRSVRCFGEAGHSGTVPRSLRRDALLASVELAHRMERYWAERETAGDDLVMTFGRFGTDAASHGLTVIPGAVEFSVDIRSHDQSVLDRTWSMLVGLASEIADGRGVRFEFEPPTGDPPIAMDHAIRATLKQAAADLGIAACDIASGAGHDAGDFAMAGIPTGMIFVRNENGSHNPAESMDLEDFRAGLQVLVRTIEMLAGSRAA